MTLIVDPAYERGQPEIVNSSRVLDLDNLMFPLIAGMFVAVALFLVGQRRAAGYALLTGVAGLLLHRLASIG